MSLDPNESPLWELLDFEDPVDESLLFNSVASEANDIMGFPVEYRVLLIEPNKTDPLYGENPTAQWSNPHRTKIVYEPTLEMETLNAFGFSSEDTITGMMITKSVFSRDVSTSPPKVGDAIKTLWNNKTYEVVDVGAESRMFNGKKLIWDLICRPFRHSSQSASADDIIFDVPNFSDFPESNFEYETLAPSALGDNDFIENESDLIDQNKINSFYYGYDELD